MLTNKKFSVFEAYFEEPHEKFFISNAPLVHALAKPGTFREA